MLFLSARCHLATIFHAFCNHSRLPFCPLGATYFTLPFYSSAPCPNFPGCSATQVIHFRLLQTKPLNLPLQSAYIAFLFCFFSCWARGDARRASTSATETVFFLTLGFFLSIITYPANILRLRLRA
jgi:hypothetical protein